MAFARANSGTVSYGAPMLITSSTTVSVPGNARTMLAYIIGGGGSGGVISRAANAVGVGAGGGGGGGVFLQVDLVGWRKIGSVNSESEQLFVTATVGAGGTGVTTTSQSAGNAGGTTTLALTGGLSVAVTGGGAGQQGGTNSANGGTAGGFAQAGSYYATDYVQIQKLLMPPTGGADDGGNGGGGNGSPLGSETVNTPGFAGIFFPWWLRNIGISASTAGTGVIVAGTGHVGGGGAGGFGGSGGNGAASNTAGVTATAGTGYGSGGGGACGLNPNNCTSGAGAPGCIVVVFEMEA